jgi:hypothetical protein
MLDVTDRRAVRIASDQGDYLVKEGPRRPARPPPDVVARNPQQWPVRRRDQAYCMYPGLEGASMSAARAEASILARQVSLWALSTRESGSSCSNPVLFSTASLLGRHGPMLAYTASRLASALLICAREPAPIAAAAVMWFRRRWRTMPEPVFRPS